MKNIDQTIFDIAVNAGAFVRCTFIACVAFIVIAPIVVFL
jgi:hypothetical protein